MKGKNYANLVRVIFGDPKILEKEKEINQNVELANAVDQLLEDMWDPFDMEYIAINDVILEGKSKEEFVEYIRNNAEDLAKNYMTKALRKLRRPNQSQKIRPLIEFKDE